MRIKEVYKKYRKNEQLREILGAIAQLGFILILVIAVPNAAGHIMKLLGMVPDRRSRMRVERSIRSLEKNKFIRYRNKGDRKILEITEKGKLYWTRLNIKNIKLPKEKIWDGKWRIITFDIPEIKSDNRRKFGGILNLIGMYNLEKSVFAYPYECRDLIYKISDAYEVREFVRYIVASQVERDQLAKKFFKLK